MSENKILFYGANDDCVEFEGFIEGEFYLDGSSWEGYLVGRDGGRMDLKACYVREWQLSVSTYSGEPVDWPARFTSRPDRQYEPAIEITVPEGTKLVIPDPTEG